MLETRELYKVYKPKKGQPVVALNKVSLKFPEKGMVFLLGKSGSGKSTLLNLLGGLDKYDGGEILIKNVSSKDFKQGDFDSYRNTYVGFIFQEYNILEEFTVGANIALALELQGRKATDEEINKILEEVDLAGYGNRKPNELSGGQKQRVAIARALVKNPQIIMADEPTGALDSNTGRQIFDTLKKLSKDKLVIIVSHDREFSELYADRIIELSDGNVISDVETIDNSTDEVLSYDEIYQGLNFVGDTIEVAAGYHLTEEDRIQINEYIDKIQENSAQIVIGRKTKFAKKFVETNHDRIIYEDNSPFKTIKSKLPLKSAFKIGASALKYKKIRLVFTILLSCIAFGLFGLADTFGSYNHIKTCTNSLIDSNVKVASLMKSVKEGTGTFAYYNSWQTGIKQSDLETVEAELGMDFVPVINVENGSIERSVDWSKISKDEKIDFEFNIYMNHFNGIASVNEKDLKNFEYEILAGKLPSKDNEITISKYAYMTFEKCGYRELELIFSEEGKYNEYDSADQYESIEKYEDLLGKTVYIQETEYTIVGIVDTKLDFERYKPMMEVKDYRSNAEELLRYALMSEFSYEATSGLASVAIVTENEMKKYIDQNIITTYTRNNNYWYRTSDNSVDVNAWRFASENQISKFEDIVWVDGPKTTLGEKEIIVAYHAIFMRDDEGKYQVDFEDEESKKAFAKKVGEYDLVLEKYSNYSNEITTEAGYKIVGVIMDEYNDVEMIVPNKVFEEEEKGASGEYDYIIAAMPENRADVKKLVEYAYRDEDVRYSIQSAVTYELDMIDEVLKVLSKVFFWIGVFFACFAAILLANFIATSVTYKKQEIGILRAIGSRSNDVFRIFFSESFIIAMINFVLSATAVGGLTLIINIVIRKTLNILVTVLTFGIRQVVLLFLISIAVAFVASFLPVKKIASKKPIDAIRNR